MTNKRHKIEMFFINNIILFLCLPRKSEQFPVPFDEKPVHYKVKLYLEHQTVKVGESATFYCNSTRILKNELPTAMELGKVVHSIDPHRICEMEINGAECDEPRANVISYSPGLLYGNMTVSIHNITWTDRGKYYCYVLQNVKSYAKLEVLSPPETIHCNKSKHLFNGLNMITCSVSCTNLQPDNFHLNGNIFEVAEFKRESARCKGSEIGMTKYDYHVIVGNNYENASIEINSVCYNKTFRVPEIIHSESSVSQFINSESKTDRVIYSFLAYIFGTLLLGSIILHLIFFIRYCPNFTFKRNCFANKGKKVPDSDSYELEPLIKNNIENGLHGDSNGNQRSIEVEVEVINTGDFIEESINDEYCCEVKEWLRVDKEIGKYMEEKIKEDDYTDILLHQHIPHTVEVVFNTGDFIEESIKDKYSCEVKEWLRVEKEIGKYMEEKIKEDDYPDIQLHQHIPHTVDDGMVY